MKKFLFYLSIIFKPKWWIILGHYNAEVDKLLNELMEKHKFEPPIGGYSKLGTTRWWVCNYPASAFEPHKINRIRPSRYTIYKAYQKFIRDTLLDNDGGEEK